MLKINLHLPQALHRSVDDPDARRTEPDTEAVRRHVAPFVRRHFRGVAQEPLLLESCTYTMTPARCAAPPCKSSALQARGHVQSCHLARNLAPWPSWRFVSGQSGAAANVDVLPGSALGLAPLQKTAQNDGAWPTTGRELSAGRAAGAAGPRLRGGGLQRARL